MGHFMLASLFDAIAAANSWGRTLRLSGVDCWAVLSSQVLDPPGYKTNLVRDPSGTILLVELPNGRNVAGNDWPSFCAGPGPV